MTEDPYEQLQLIYGHLQEAEKNPEKRLELLERSRTDLGRILGTVDQTAKPGIFNFMSKNGAKGGAVKSSAKAAAARANGAKGGRPKSISPFKRFTASSIQVLMFSQDEAVKLGINRCGTEQLLVGLLREESGQAAKALGAMGLTVTNVRKRVIEILDQKHALETDSNLPQPGVIATWMRSLRNGKEVPFSHLAKSALEMSWEQAKRHGENCIDTEHLLLGILELQDCSGLEILRHFDIDLNQLCSNLNEKRSMPVD